MRALKSPFLIVTIALVLLSTAASQVDDRRRTQRHATREQALALLTREGFYHPDTHRVLSANWYSDIQKWLITLERRDGAQTYWFVDAQAQDYSGGTCRQ